MIFTVDLNFLNLPGTIAVYLIPHSNGIILVECGPGSTIPTLIRGIEKLGYSPSQITHILLTHIHLDHAGAAGFFASHGAHIYVHNVGAPHLLDPQKLLSSAERIYGNKMYELWGQFLPVPENKLTALADGEAFEIEDRKFTAIDTPGHANHHLAYIFNEVCFCGDIGGIRMQNTRHIRLPMPPPEFNLEQWFISQKKLQNLYLSGAFSRLAPTHFGIFDDALWHLNSIKSCLAEIDNWMLEVMTGETTFEILNEQFISWTHNRSIREGINPKVLEVYEAANPSWMSSYGIERYWRKYRAQRNEI